MFDYMFNSWSFSSQVEKMNVEALSRAELLTLLSILEGELEAQDVVIHTLRVSLEPQHLACRQHHACSTFKNHRTIKYPVMLAPSKQFIK